MDIKSLKEIVNSELSENIKELKIIRLLASDEKALPEMIKILNEERRTNKELITDMNAELSRAHVYIDMRPEGKVEAKESFNKGFIMDEIAKFYIKYKGVVRHCFNRFT